MGHDVYLYTQGVNPNLDFSALGFLWTQYQPDSFRYVAAHFPPEIWTNIEAILPYPALYVALAFALIIYVPALLISKLFNKKQTQFSSRRKWNRGA